MAARGAILETVKGESPNDKQTRGADALEEFCYNEGFNAFAKGAEWVDCVVRCYMLNQCIADYIEQNEDDLTERIERLNG